jgi:hypothetical protein
MVDTTTKTYQDKQRKKALKQRDSNVKNNERDNKKFLQDAYKNTYNKVMEITE